MEELKPREDKKEDLQTKDSLSIDGWVTMVSSEISSKEDFSNNMIMIMVVFSGIVLGLLPFALQLHTEVLVGVIYLIFFLSMYWLTMREQKKVDKLEEIRKQIISNSPDLNKIRKDWEKYKRD
jgi:hypothetical protein